MLREAGVNCTLLTDERTVIEHPLAIEFDNCIQIDPPWQSLMAAEGAYEETHLARCFLQIIDWVQTAKRPFFLWCHLGSLGTTWDAPPECRERYWDESDPPLLATADVPDRMLKRASTRTNSWSTRKPMPGRLRCWILAWADFSKCSTNTPPPIRRY